MDSAEFAEWLAYDRLEPIGDRRGDFQAALIARTIAEVNRDEKARQSPFTIDDFVLRFDVEPDRGPDEETLYQKFQYLALVMNNIPPKAGAEV